MSQIDSNMLGIFVQVLYRHAEIISGAYKHRKMRTGIGKDADGKTIWRPYIEDELLRDSMSVMRAQIHRLQDCIDGRGD